jgi:glycosyltransferase involved in cell wall biosynthesis
MKLSIIIPFYNVEKYIAVCLDSVYAQDIPEKEYEVICINDCSPDKSREIVLEYQKRHENLILIEHETNKMLGAGRNTGLHAARGKYIWFIDSDDFIAPNVFAKLLSKVESDNLDVLQFNSQRVTNNGELSDNVFFPKEINVSSGMDFCKKYLFQYWNLNTWFKIFKKTFLIDNSLQFPEGVFYEDSLHSLKSLFYAARFSYCTDIIYYYRLNPDSIMNKNHYSGLKLSDRVRLHIDSINFVYSFFKNNDIEFRDALINAYAWAIKKYRKSIILMTSKEKSIFYERIKVLNFKLTVKYLKWNESVFYTNPLIIKFAFLFISPILFFIKKVKNK